MASRAVIRDAVSSDVESYVKWGLDEGWNMSQDVPTYFASYPKGWLIAQVCIFAFIYIHFFGNRCTCIH